MGRIAEGHAGIYINLALSGGEDFYKKIAEEIIPYFSADRIKVLDIGTGPGLLPIEIIKLAANKELSVFGLDLCEGLLKFARRQSCNIYSRNKVKFLKANAQFLPFADCKFNAIIMIGVLHGLNNSMQVFNEIHRILKPGGLIFIYDPTRFNLNGDKEKKFIKNLSLKWRIIYRIFSLFGILPPKCWSVEQMNKFIANTVKIKFNCLKLQKCGEKKNYSDYWRIILQRR